MPTLGWFLFFLFVAIGTITITTGSIEYDRFHRPVPRFYRDRDGDGIMDTDDSRADDDYADYEVLVIDDDLTDTDADGQQDFYTFHSDFITPTTPPPDYESGEEEHRPDRVAQREFLRALYSPDFQLFIVQHMHRLFIDEYTFDDGISDNSPAGEQSQSGVTDGGPFARRIVFKHRNCEFSLLLEDRETAVVYLSARNGVPTTAFVATLPLPKIIVHEEEIERYNREVARQKKMMAASKKGKRPKKTKPKTPEEKEQMGRLARRKRSYLDDVLDIAKELLWPTVIIVFAYILYRSLMCDYML